MNLANQLTLARFLCVPAFMIFTYFDNFYTRLFAFFIFVAAGITDLVDGYIARKYNMTTPLGALLDPLADKLIVTAAFISFIELREIHIPAWMVVAIVGREFIITGLRTLAASRGYVLKADEDGKFKTSVQVTAVITILIILIFLSAIERFAGLSWDKISAESSWRVTVMEVLLFTPYWMVFIATLFSLVTGISYLRKHKELLTERPPK